MAKKEESSMLNKVGPWAFILGLLIAVVAAFIKPNTAIIWGLGALGIVVGLVNVTDKEMKTFLLATVAFMTAANGLTTVLATLAASIPVFGQSLSKALVPFTTNVIVFVAPAAAVVALKALYNISRD
jgi:hypothetical protein